MVLCDGSSPQITKTRRGPRSVLGRGKRGQETVGGIEPLFDLGGLLRYRSVHLVQSTGTVRRRDPASQGKGIHPSASCEKDGAGEGTRTPDPIITNDVLYQLSYTGILLCRGPTMAILVTPRRP